MCAFGGNDIECVGSMWGLRIYKATSIILAQ